jgi:hypothetical protein
MSLYENGGTPFIYLFICLHSVWKKKTKNNKQTNSGESLLAQIKLVNTGVEWGGMGRDRPIIQLTT